MMGRVFLFLTYLVLIATVCCLRRPNFVFILTDDQDLILGGMDPMKKMRKLIKNAGAEFKNMFVTSPLCCPSRASILSGRYVHNHGVVNNSISGNCNSYFWQNNFEKTTFITFIKNFGYTTFYAGKYLNQYGSDAAGGASHIPPGWDHWIGLVGNSCYYNYSLSINGKIEYHGSNVKDYLTDIVFDRAVDFLSVQNNSEPFFLMIAPPAPHSPFSPAPQYEKFFPSAHAPRSPNFNFPSNKTKHWLLRQPPFPLPNEVIHSIDEVFRNRWRTLLSVDDGIEKLHQILLKKQVLEDTYIFFSSDNGFHLGQFGLPWDKRQLYDFDIRVPLVVRGPNIKAGIQIQAPVLNIDLAPTFLSLAGINPPHDMDGTSFALFFKPADNQKENERSFLVEHNGEVTHSILPSCPQYAVGEVHTCEIDCICEDSWNNSYSCVRTLSSVKNTMFCYFKDNEGFIEVYNITSDPYQLQNLYRKTDIALYMMHIEKLKLLSSCIGNACVYEKDAKS